MLKKNNVNGFFISETEKALWRHKGHLV